MTRSPHHSHPVDTGAHTALDQLADQLRTRLTEPLPGPVAQRAMAAARTGRREGMFHREAPPPGFVARVLPRHELVERDRPVPAPQPVRRAEIRNAGLRGDAGAGEHMLSPKLEARMLQELGGATVIGPILVGLDRPVQIVQLGASDNQLVNMAALAAFNVSG